MERQLVTKPGTSEAKANDYRPSSLSHEPHFQTRGFLHSRKNLSNKPKLYPAKLQTKLEVSQPGDSYEQETEQVDEQVMRMPTTSVSSMEFSKIPVFPDQVKRKCSNSCKQKPDFYSSGYFGDRIPQPQRNTADQAVQRLLKSRALQAKLRIGQPNDIYEQEADRVAEQVMRMPQPALQQKCGKCDKDEKDVLYTKKFSGQVPLTQVQDIPPIVHDTLRSSGKPLDTSTRAFMEPRFGYDFSQVRLHTDYKAAESARKINALAYTVGRDVVFGVNQYSPKTTSGLMLLAHELTHVVQQYGQLGQLTRFQIDALEVPSEPENKAISSQIQLNQQVHISRMPWSAVLQRLTCDELKNATESVRVNGTAAHEAIVKDFAGKVGSRAFPITKVPNASFAQQRLECGDDPASSHEGKRTKYSGHAGIPDIVYLNSNNDVELAEIKFAHETCMVEGLSQVKWYKSRGNKFRKWREEAGIGKLQIMPQGRFTPGPTVDVGVEPVSVAWCRNGLIMYKAVREQDPEIFLCSSLSDKGKITRFLDRLAGRAEGSIDQYINEVVDPKITQAIKTVSIQDAVRMLYRFARTELLQILKTKGIIIDPILKALPEEAAVEYIAKRLEQEMKGLAEQELRRILLLVKDRVFEKVRTKLKMKVKEYLNESLRLVCGAIAITAAKLLQKFWKDIGKYFGRELGEEVLALARELMEELAKIAKALSPLLAVMAIIVFILLLPEELLAGAAAALLALARFLIQLIPDLVPVLGPALAEAPISYGSESPATVTSVTKANTQV